MRCTIRILYLARHDQLNSGDDEGAITHALTQLGHDVQRVHENKASRAYRIKADLLLFHKFSGFDIIRSLEMKKVFWWFDLVDFADSTLKKRCHNRKQYMKDVTPLVDLGFLTDGDHVAKDTTGKLVWLPQGADERVIGFGWSRVDAPKPDVMFSGTEHGGLLRSSHIRRLKEKYGSRFLHVENAYGRKLADVIASSKIVVAPDGPVTDKYWSNRVYLTLGFGGFLLHPYCKMLAQGDATHAEMYEDGKEIVFYHSRDELEEKIDYYLSNHSERRHIQHAGYERTLKQHLYQHRCKKLIQIVQERLGLS